MNIIKIAFKLPISNSKKIKNNYKYLLAIISIAFGLNAQADEALGQRLATCGGVMFGLGKAMVKTGDTSGKASQLINEVQDAFGLSGNHGMFPSEYRNAMNSIEYGGPNAIKQGLSMIATCRNTIQQAKDIQKKEYEARKKARDDYLASPAGKAAIALREAEEEKARLLALEEAKPHNGKLNWTDNGTRYTYEGDYSNKVPNGKGKLKFQNFYDNGTPSGSEITHAGTFKNGKLVEGGIAVKKIYGPLIAESMGTYNEVGRLVTGYEKNGIYDNSEVIFIQDYTRVNTIDISKFNLQEEVEKLLTQSTISKKQGTLTFSNGNKFTGEYINNTPLNGKLTYSQSSKLDSFTGEFDKITGNLAVGTLTYKDGSIVIGAFKDLKPYNATGTYPNGQTVKWTNGVWQQVTPAKTSPSLQDSF